MTTESVPLFKQLKERRLFCPPELGGGEYLPQSAVDEYAKEPHITREGVPEDLVQTIEKSAQKIFIALYVADKIKIARDILECGIRDADLPLRLGEGEDHLISGNGRRFQPFRSPWSNKNHRHVEAFLDKQWMVQPHILDDSGEHHSLDPKCALPFLDTLKPLGTVERAVFDCTIHKDYFRNVDGSPQPLQDSGSNSDTKEQNSGLRVAVKKFTNYEDFKREINALRAARKANRPNLIRFLSSCQKSNTYYILLPWAEGSTLQHYWMVNGPKTAVRDRALIRKSIDQLLQLSTALQFLHSINFRHGDLKPDNILHFINPSRQLDRFVIADLGISIHHHHSTNHRDRKATSMKATTLAYEAPEVWADSRSPRSRKYDVWSMGCIILEYIIWLLWDADALDAFADSRQRPNFAFYLGQNSPKTAIVHPEVTRAMKTARKDPRCAAGTALRDLIDLVERGLLVVNVEKRWDSGQLHSALAKIARKASAKGTGDAYALPLKAAAPTRPPIFCNAGARRPPQSKISVLRLGTGPALTTSTIELTPMQRFSATWAGSPESPKIADRGWAGHAAAATAPAAPKAPPAAGASKRRSVWTLLMRTVGSASRGGDRDSDTRGVAASRRAHYADRVQAKMRLWRERGGLFGTSHEDEGLFPGKRRLGPQRLSAWRGRPGTDSVLRELG